MCSVLDKVRLCVTRNAGLFSRDVARRGVVGVCPYARTTPESVSCPGRPDQRAPAHRVPVREAFGGRLHLYLHSISKRTGAVCNIRIPLIPRTFTVIQTVEAVRALLSNSHLDGRIALFLTQFALENKGFSFRDLDSVAIKQKRLLKQFLDYESRSFSPALTDVVSNVCRAMATFGVASDLEPVFRKLLADVFSNLVSPRALISRGDLFSFDGVSIC